MLTDYWVIALLVSQFFSLLLLLRAGFFAGKIIRHWSALTADELQLSLERKSYLVGSIIQFVLIFQLASLLMFLNIANHHLPDIVKGAMCATGTLGVNGYGYFVLFLKMTGVLIYASYLMLNYLDNSEPSYPLTPFKYWLVFPALLLVVMDAYTSFQYFWQIEPDIIATCCSVSFTDPGSAGLATLSAESLSSGIWWVYVLSFLALLFTSWGNFGLSSLKEKIWYFTLLRLGVALIYVLSAVYTLRHFFVKYIYGLPTHDCLFDIFWAKYHYIGYLLFGSYYGLVLSLLFLALYQMASPYLHTSHLHLSKILNRWHLLFLALSFGVPLLYWLSWSGQL